MTMKWSPGCLCCGDPSNGISAVDCCIGSWLAEATITNFTLTNNATSETWTQDGASSWQGVGSKCFFDIPVDSSVDGADIIALQHLAPWIDAGTYSNSWKLVMDGDNVLGGIGWTAGDTSVSISFGNYSGSFDIAGVLPCGCCDECPYEPFAITDLSFTYAGDLHTQSLESRFAWQAYDYCGWGVLTTGGTIYNFWRVVKSGSNYGLLDGVLTSRGSGTMSGCTGSVTLAPSAPLNGFSSGSFTITSSGNCPDEL